jgi:signal peptidase II
VTRGPFKWPLALAVGVLIVILDQWSKHAITAAFRHGEVLPVTSFFNLVMVHNAGAAFSFLSDASGWQRGFFIGITALAMAVIVWMMRRHREELLFCWGLAFVAAGAVGNLIDRVSYGYVIDFLDFHAAGWHFWAFNVADSAITLGAGLLILDSFRPRKSS